VKERPAAPMGSQGPQRSAARARLAFFRSKGSGALSVRRLALAPLLALVALALLALVLPLTASADPLPTVNPVTEHTITTAHVTGQITTDQAAETYWGFQYRPVLQGEAAANQGPEDNWANGPALFTTPLPPETSNPVAETLTGLNAQTEYEIRLLAYPLTAFFFDPAPGTPGPSFTTDPAPVAPSVELEPPTPSYISAQIQGSVDPEGGNLNGPGEPVPIHWVIELSESGEPETFFVVSEGDITGAEAEESNPIAVPAAPAEPGLPQNTTFHYRLRATYAGQQVLTSDATFKTKEVQKPELTIADASALSYQRAHLSGTVKLATNDPAFNSSCEFQYATEADFSNASAVACEPGAGTILASEAQPVSVSADLTGLAPNTTYHLRLVAGNSGGTETQSAPDTFETLTVAKPTIENLAIGAITPHTALFSAEVDPGAPKPKAEADAAEQEAFLTHYHFQCEPECPGLEEKEVPAGKDPEEVSVEATGLIPGVHYAVSLFASNAGGEEPPAGPVQFTTEAEPPTIDATFATAVSETEVTLGAKVNPGGAPTTVHFDYVTLEQFESSEEGGFAQAEATESEPAGSRFPTQLNCTEAEESSGCIPDATPTQLIAGLQPGTAYRYRVVATNEKSPAGLAGPTKGFTTATAPTAFTGTCPANEQLRRENNSTALPDCRAYEQVSPMEKGGYSAYAKSSPVQASPDGEKFRYPNFHSFPGAPGNAAFDEHVSTRTPSGWRTQEWVYPNPIPSPFGSGGFFATYSFSEDLTQAAIKLALVELVPGVSPNASHLFLAHAGGEYSLIDSAPPKVSPEEGCPGHEFFCFVGFDVSVFAGATPDFSHILFESNAQYTEKAPQTGIQSLYERSGGEVSLVGFLPDGEPAAASSAGGGSALEPAQDMRVENAISADGSKVIFKAPSDGVEPGEAGQASMNEVYDRIEGTHTIELSAPNPGATPENPAAAPATFWAASKDGSRVFFTSAAELTTASNTGPAGEHEDLYEYDFKKLPGNPLTDLSVAAGPAGASVLGVVNASADGSSIYFVAEGQLDGAKGIDGQPNLYLLHEREAPVFIATLGQGDAHIWAPNSITPLAYVDPDGKHMAFMSTQSLPTANFPTGYDNIVQSTGGAASEVYLYNAPSGGGEGQLICGSCDPSGAQPLGSALIGGFSRSDEGGSAGIGTPFYRTAALSENGSRLFYTAPKKNGFEGVFEYERAGEGSCGEAGGCQYLISNPGGEISDHFLGSAHGGRDVFFVTFQRLVPGDEDNVSDVYDAREGGGFAVPPPPPHCEGAEACHGKGPETGYSPSSASTTFAGSEEGPKHLRCAKGQAKRHGHCVGKHHKSKKRHSKRHANTNRRASR
jgi:hypothetical protein